MIIELLKVKAQEREQYLQKDAETWTQVLTGCTRFLGKEVWRNLNEPTEVILIMGWASRTQLKSIPLELLNGIEQKFAQQLGNTYQIVESFEYQVHFEQS